MRSDSTGDWIYPGKTSDPADGLGEGILQPLGDSALPEGFVEEEYLFSGEAVSYVPEGPVDTDGFWTGSLLNFEGLHGYWIITDSEINFSYDLDTETLSRKSITLFLSSSFPSNTFLLNHPYKYKRNLYQLLQQSPYLLQS